MAMIHCRLDYEWVSGQPLFFLQKYCISKSCHGKFLKITRHTTFLDEFKRFLVSRLLQTV